MLVLSRKTGERIIMAGGVVVTVLAVRGRKVQLGVTAPPDTWIHREEIHQQIADEGRLAQNALA